MVANTSVTLSSFQRIQGKTAELIRNSNTSRFPIVSRATPAASGDWQVEIISQLVLTVDVFQRKYELVSLNFGHRRTSKAQYKRRLFFGWSEVLFTQNVVSPLEVFK
jgi:hypothetical protein